MVKNHLAIWRFVVSFWPVFAVFVLIQWVVRMFGNTAAIAIPWWLSLLDLFVFIAVFAFAATWVSLPLRSGVAWLKSPTRRTAQSLEKSISSLPDRAVKGFVIAGMTCALYLLLVLSIGAAVSHVILSPRMFIALFLCLFYTVGVLAPSVSCAMSLEYSVRLRHLMASSNLFLHGLDSGHAYEISWNRVSRRPWLIFIITSALPASILAFFVYLILGADSEVERNFILLQSGVLFISLVLAGTWLVFSLGKVLKRTMTSFTDGLSHMRQGQFDGMLPVLSDDEFGELARGMNTAFSGLKEREELKHGLEIAAEIHHAMLPSITPNIENYGIQCFQQSCYAVGGDYYDHIILPDGRAWLLLADVAGKGYPAAFTVANLRAMFHSLAHLDMPFEQAAAYVNNNLCETLSGGRFVTLFMAKLQPQSHSMLWLNAGHLPALLYRNGDIESLEASSPPMGLEMNMHLQVSTCQLALSDTLLVYSDGITEAKNNESGEMFGEKRVKNALLQHQAASLEDLSDELLHAVDDFGELASDDDVTMLLLRRES